MIVGVMCRGFDFCIIWAIISASWPEIPPALCNWTRSSSPQIMGTFVCMQRFRRLLSFVTHVKPRRLAVSRHKLSWKDVEPIWFAAAKASSSSGSTIINPRSINSSTLSTPLLLPQLPGWPHELDRYIGRKARILRVLFSDNRSRRRHPWSWAYMADGSQDNLPTGQQLLHFFNVDP